MSDAAAPAVRSREDGSWQVLLLALLIVLWEHRLYVTHRTDAAQDVNRVARIAVLGGIYPCCILALASYGFGSTWALILILCLVCPAIMGASVIAMRRLAAIGQHQRQHAIVMLQRSSPENADFKQVLKKAYHAFDVNASGSIDVDELRELVKSISAFESLNHKELHNVARAAFGLTYPRALLPFWLQSSPKDARFAHALTNDLVLDRGRSWI